MENKGIMNQLPEGVYKSISINDILELREERARENNKYYLPTTEDLVHGLEYEEKAWKHFNEENVEIPSYSTYIFRSEEYYKQKTIDLLKPFNSDGGSDYIHFLSKMSEGNLRVKYLDAQDIESFQIPLDEWFVSKHKYGGTYKITVYGLEWNPKITIKMKDFIRDGSGNFEETTKVYRLNIKNKSEFGKLLKQSNIIE